MWEGINRDLTSALLHDMSSRIKVKLCNFLLTTTRLESFTQSALCKQESDSREVN